MVDQGADTTRSRQLEQQAMRNWYLLAGLCLVSTLGLLVALAPEIRMGLRGFWPWPKTDWILLMGLGGITALLVLHLTRQQQAVHRMRTRIRHKENEENERRRSHASRLHALLNVTRMMGAVSDPLRVFEAITNTCLEIFDCQQASLMLLDDEKTHLQMKAAAGHLNLKELMNVSQPVGRGVAGYVAENRTPVVLGEEVDISRYPGMIVPKHKLSAAMVVPILVRDELVGVLNISSRTRGTAYTDEDLKALQVFAENAGNCIRQAERSEWMRQTIDQYRQAQEKSLKPIVNRS